MKELKLAFWSKLYKFEENLHIVRRQKCPTIFGQNVIILPQWAAEFYGRKFFLLLFSASSTFTLWSLKQTDRQTDREEKIVIYVYKYDVNRNIFFMWKA